MSLSISQTDLITRALVANGTFAPGDNIPPDSFQTGSQLLAEIIDEWASQANALTVLTVNRFVYNLVSNQGGPNFPYTYGPGGDFDTGTAIRPPMIQDANLILNNSTPAVEIPMAVVTTDMYAAQAIKDLTNSLPVWLYYNDTVPLGQVFLWPIPLDSVNQLALYVPVTTAQFPDLTSLVVMPPGYLKAFRLCLQESMITPFAVNPQVAAKVMRDAEMALTALKVSNAAGMMGDMSVDPMFTPNPRGTYVIQTDQELRMAASQPVLDQELVWTVTGLPAGGASASGSIAPFPPVVRGNYVEFIVYVEFNHTTDSGKVTIESAYSDDYAGTWAQVGTSTIDWSAIDTVKSLSVTGVFGALRARISTAVTTGSLKVKVVGSSK